MAHTIVEGSIPDYDNDMDLFTMPSTSSGIESINLVTIRPTTQLQENGPIDFRIPATGSQYIDFEKTLLSLKLRIEHSDGTPLKTDEYVAPINYILNTIWSQIEVKLQQKNVCGTSLSYSYKSYIEALLTYSRDPKNTQLQTSGWLLDAPGSFDQPPGGGNAEATSRWAKFIENGEVNFVGPLHIDIFNSANNRLLLNGIDVNITMTPNKSEFTLIAGESEHSYKLSIVDIALQICKKTLSPELMVSHIKSLEKQNAIFPCDRTEIKPIAISKGEYMINVDNLFQGTVPNSLVICFVDSKAYQGSITKNPLKLQHNNISKLILSVDDIPVQGGELDLSFSKPKNFTTAYYNLFKSQHRDRDNFGNGIKLDDFDKGLTIFPFEIAFEKSEGGFAPIKRGNVQLKVTFDRPLAESTTCLCMAKFSSTFEIDFNRNVILP